MSAVLRRGIQVSMRRSTARPQGERRGCRGKGRYHRARFCLSPFGWTTPSAVPLPPYFVLRARWNDGLSDFFVVFLFFFLVSFLIFFFFFTPERDVQVGKFYMVFMDEKDGREGYQVPDQAFSSEEDALRAAAKKTNLRSQLLSFCQVTGGERNCGVVEIVRCAQGRRVCGRCCWWCFAFLLFLSEKT